MESSSEDGHCRFFDAHEDIASSSGLNSDRFDPADISSAFDNFGHGENPLVTWIGSPVSAKERRSKFLDWMGLVLNQNSRDNSVDATSFGENDSRVREMSGAVLRTLSLGEEFSSSRSSVSSLHDGSSDLVKFSSIQTFVPREGDLNGARTCEYLDVLQDHYEAGDCPRTDFERSVEGVVSEATSVSSSCFQHFPEQEAEKQSKLAEIVKKVKRSWLGRLHMKASHQDRQGENQECTVLGHKVQRVKVKQYKKQMKELSGLYKGQEIQAHEGSILAMKFSPDGQYLVSAGEDEIVRVWQVVEDERSDDHVPETDASSVYFEVDDLCQLKPVLVGKDGTKKLRSPRKNADSACIVFPPKIFRLLETPLHEFHGHKGDILDLSWSNNGYLLSASADKTVRLWRVGCDHCFGVFPHGNYVTSVQFNPVDENHFISGSIDGKVRIWAISGCQVVEWVDVRDIVTAVCYRPDGQAVIIGTMSSSCRFYTISDNRLQLDAKISLHNKKKSHYKRITGFQFFPKDPTRVMVISADFQVRILHGLNVVRKYKGLHAAGSQISASFTSDGKHIISACDDSNVYIWNCFDSEELYASQPNKIRSCERFSTDASVAIPWCGFSQDFTLASPSWFSLGQEFILDTKGYATWPEENLPSSPLCSSKIHKSQSKFLKASCERTLNSHAWGLVIVTAGWDGRIRSFHNYGLPVAV